MPAYPTLHEIIAAADEFWGVWQQLLAEAPELRQAIGQHTASALGWKVEGEVAPLEAAERVYELGDSIHLGPVNQERSILTLRKPQAFALDTMQHIKLLQRRPSSPDDSLGADSLDFYVGHGLPKLEDVRAAVDTLDVVVAAQKNEAHSWISLRYSDHEFKLANLHVWEICVKEAAELLSR